jgi:hypothetical protein
VIIEYKGRGSSAGPKALRAIPHDPVGPETTRFISMSTEKNVLDAKYGGNCRTLDQPLPASRTARPTELGGPRVFIKSLRAA